MRGRKPEPTSERTLARLERPVSTGSGSGVAAPPETLTSEGQVIWDGLVPDLQAAGVFRPSDGYLLVELVESLADAKRFRRQLATLDDLAGQEARYLRIGAEKAMALVVKLAAEFGITPVARLRLGLMQVKGASLLEMLDSED